MADGQTDLDKKVGNEPADVVPWKNDGAKWRPDSLSPDDKMPVKSMPMKDTPKPFVIKGGGDGG